MSGSCKPPPKGIELLNFLHRSGFTLESCRCPSNVNRNKGTHRNKKEYYLVTYEQFKTIIHNGKLQIYLSLLKEKHFYPSKHTKAIKLLSKNEMSLKSYSSFIRLLKQLVACCSPAGCIELHSLPSRGRGTRTTGKLVSEWLHISIKGLYSECEKLIPERTEDDSTSSYPELCEINYIPFSNEALWRNMLANK